MLRRTFHAALDHFYWQRPFIQKVNPKLLKEVLIFPQGYLPTICGFGWAPFGLLLIRFFLFICVCGFFLFIFFNKILLDPRHNTHDPRQFTHDPRQLTHDPRPLATPAFNIQIHLGDEHTFQSPFRHLLSLLFILKSNKIRQRTCRKYYYLLVSISS